MLLMQIRSLLGNYLRLKKCRLLWVILCRLGTFETELSHVKLSVVLAVVDSLVEIDLIEVVMVFLDELNLALNLNLVCKISAILCILNSWL